MNVKINFAVEILNNKLKKIEVYGIKNQQMPVKY